MTAAQRKTPTQSNGGTNAGVGYTNAVNVENEALWKSVFGWLTSVGGTANAITAASDTTLVIAIAAYARPMGFYLPVASTNTGAVTINIDGVGAVNIRDRFGSALVGGELGSGGAYKIVFDGSNFRAINVTSGAAASITNRPTLIVNDTKTAGTAGGTFTSGSWTTRTLNTAVLNEISGASLGSSQITLPPGSYYVEWSAPGFGCASHQTRFRNVTDSSVVAEGTSEYASIQGHATSRSRGCISFTIASTKAFSVEHRCGTTAASNGLGVAASLGTNEIYTEVRIWRTG